MTKTGKYRANYRCEVLGKADDPNGFEVRVLIPQDDFDVACLVVWEGLFLRQAEHELLRVLPRRRIKKPSEPIHISYSLIEGDKFILSRLFKTEVSE